MVEAYLSLRYAECQQETAIQFYTESLGVNFRLEMTPESALYDFTQSLNSGNEIQCISLFNSLMDTIDKTSNPIIAQIGYYQIANAILKIIHNLNIKETSTELNLLFLFQNTDMFRHNMNLIITEVCRCARIYQDAHKEDSLTKIWQYVDNHYLDYNLSLYQIAADYGMSVSLVSKLFKSNTGTGFKDYLVRKRIEEARNRLCNTATPIQEIAEAVGYKDVSHFIKMFKLTIGLTPAQYRKQYGLSHRP